MQHILFLLEDYNHFYTHHTNAILKNNSSSNYTEILNTLTAKKYYQADSMAKAFQKLGYTTSIIVPEANPLQLLWAKQNNKLVYFKWLLQKPMRSFKSRFLKQHRNSYNSIQFNVLLQQVKTIKPDIIYFYSNIFITQKQIETLKKHSKKIVLQWTCPIWNIIPYSSFDIIITAAIQLKEYFDAKKINSIYIQQAFDDSIIDQLLPKSNQYKGDVVFIGNFALGHTYRFEVLEYLLQNNIDLTIYGSGKNYVPKTSLVHTKIQPGLFGIDMYNEYQNYKMAIHIHTTGFENDGINWDKYAGAKRLFEITGSGTLFLTTHQQNIKDLYEIDKEVVTFKNAEELLQKINYFLIHSNEAETIAKNGQLRTLKSHSFMARAIELEPILFSTTHL